MRSSHAECKKRKIKGEKKRIKTFLMTCRIFDSPGRGRREEIRHGRLKYTGRLIQLTPARILDSISGSRLKSREGNGDGPRASLTFMLDSTRRTERRTAKRFSRMGAGWRLLRSLEEENSPKILHWSSSLRAIWPSTLAPRSPRHQSRRLEGPRLSPTSSSLLASEG
ncbi:hypothetical protein VTN96DRAFT_6390 [Rasamsonia emersonii]